MPEEKLKPCPFCGGEANIISHSVYRSFIYYCSCSNQECHGFCSWTFEYSFGFKDKEKAIIAWNTRPDEKLVPLDSVPVREIIRKAFDIDRLLADEEIKKSFPNTVLEMVKAVEESTAELCASFGSVPVVPERKSDGRDS